MLHHFPTFQDNIFGIFGVNLLNVDGDKASGSSPPVATAFAIEMSPPESQTISNIKKVQLKNNFLKISS